MTPFGSFGSFRSFRSTFIFNSRKISKQISTLNRRWQIQAMKLHSAHFKTKTIFWFAPIFDVIRININLFVTFLWVQKIIYPNFICNEIEFSLYMEKMLCLFKTKPSKRLTINKTVELHIKLHLQIINQIKFDLLTTL